MSAISIPGICVSALILAAAAPAFAASTAKAALKEVVAAGQKWQPDAVVTHVSTLFGQPDGKANSWIYTVYSPKAKKSATVTTKDTKVVEVLEVLRNTSTDPIGDFIDSDQATAAAAKAGLTLDKGAKDLMMGLVVGGQAVGKPTLYWTVSVMRGDNLSGVTLSGKDGTFIKRDDVKFK
ncbi:MAG TPA: hypothetical protein VFR86_06840 [Burkholderiaceae bacterium]|nr:hypothetical protein [Burkholderiaceae bacterium]